MGWLVGCLLVIIAGQLWYIRRLRNELRAHVNNWVEIEGMTDHNKSGDVVIHCRSSNYREDTGVI